MFSVTIFRPLTFARNYATIADPKKQIREVYFNRITAPKKSRAKNNTNSAKEFVLFTYGAEDEIRTRATGKGTTPLAGEPLEPLGYFCISKKTDGIKFSLPEGSAGERGARHLGGCPDRYPNNIP